MTGFTPELVERDAVVRFIREAAYTAWEDRPEGQLFLSLAKDIENEEHLHFVECRPTFPPELVTLVAVVRMTDLCVLCGSYNCCCPIAEETGKMNAPTEHNPLSFEFGKALPDPANIIAKLEAENKTLREGSAELTEALREACDGASAWSDQRLLEWLERSRTLLTKIGGNNGGRGLSQKCTQNRDRPRTFQQDPRIHALDGECVCGAESCPQCGNGR
jgi:hypothetical protein